MVLRRVPVLDSTPSVLANGYAWLPGRRRRAAGGMVRTRVLGRHAVGLCGPDAVRFFYDERHVLRHGAVPEPVLSTLFGHGGVQNLDGEAHRDRKAMFLPRLTEAEDIAVLVDSVTAAWDGALASWADRSRVVLFDEASRVITRGVCRWAGVPLEEGEVDSVAGDLVALIDGFATPGPRHWRARGARRRREAWLGRLVEEVRAGAVTVPGGSAVDVVARHRDADGRELSSRLAAVELLNVLRPTVAVCWYVAFAAHALHLWPEHRERLRGDDAAYVEAFVHEVRRFYPFAPFVGGRAARDLTWRGEPIPAGALVLLDLYGQNHDAELWAEPYTFDPRRFLDRPPGRDDLVPQGGGEVRSGHRCPGEGVIVALLRALVSRLAQLDYEVPKQDLRISLRRLPARPRSGFIMAFG